MGIDMTFQQDTIDISKVELVRSKKRKKVLVWMGFLLFGWSYGSVGRFGLQAVWYAISFFSAYNLWVTYETNTFDEYSSMGIVGGALMICWFILRLFTINRDIRKYNSHLADFFYLTPDERAEAGID